MQQSADTPAAKGPLEELLERIPPPASEELSPPPPETASDRPLVSTGLKLSRAQLHIDSAESCIREFLAREPYRLVRQFDPSTSEEYGLASISEHPPLALAVIIGDCLQNLRAALDHAIYDMTIVFNGAPLDGTAYPIAKRPDTFFGWSKKTREPALDKAVYKLRGLPWEVQAFIEAEQPYHAPNRDEDLLWILNELSNMDKHRTIHLSGSALRSHGLGFGGTGSVNFYLAHITSGPFDHGTEVFRWRNYGTTMDMHHQFTFDIAFSPGGPASGAPVMSTLHAMRDRVVGVIDVFRTLL